MSYNKGDIIVVANPGTGKTTEIVEQVLSLLQSGVKGEDIVCVTFTNKAADEMKARIFRKISSHPEFAGEVMGVEIATIHSYAMNYLESIGIRAEIASNTVLRFIVYGKLQELKTFTYGRDYLIGTIVPKMENAIRYLKSFGILPDDINAEYVCKIVVDKTRNSKSVSLTAVAVEKLVKDFISIFRAYEEFKESKSLMDFNDLLRIFLKQGPIGNKLHVLVDEFQDLNRMQVDIVGKLAEKRFFVGDRKQSIFGFQGGSLTSFHRYLNDSGFEIRGKSLNFRSTNNILDYAKHYFMKYSRDSHSIDEVKGLRNPNKGEGEKVLLIESPEPENDAVSKLKKLMSEDGSPEKEYAIIVRTNSQLEKVAKHMDSAGLNYSTTVKNRVNQTQIDDILSYISGLVSDDLSLITRALMTPFPGLTLKESLDTVGSLNKSGFDEKLLPENFRELRAIKFGTNLIDLAFQSVILPVAASIGEDYVTSATSVLASAHDYLQNFENYSLDGFLDFMSLSTEPAENDLRKTKINLLTVHKAKGLEFDTVIYVPTEPRSSLEYFDALTYAIISSTTGIDVERDLLEEPTRIDFVALTRAKDRLVVVANNRVMPKFELDDQTYIIGNEAPMLEYNGTTRYNEPYMLFINGRYREAEELLKQPKKWLFRQITDYFSNINRLSYSTISAISNPYDFLKSYILRIRETSPFAEIGEQFHQYAQKYLDGDLTAKQIPETLSGEFSNFEKVLDTLRRDYLIPPVYSEHKIEIPLSQLFPDRRVPDDITIEGRIDAVFKGRDYDPKFLIADYKTSRQVKSDYWHQIWLYTRMFQKRYDLKTENIVGGIIYVSLREAIDTGEKHSDLLMKQYGQIKTEVIENRIAEILMYREKPEAFVEKLLSKEPSNVLEERLKEALEN